jgi:hypothetical protein
MDNKPANSAGELSKLVSKTFMLAAARSDEIRLRIGYAAETARRRLVAGILQNARFNNAMGILYLKAQTNATSERSLPSLIARFFSWLGQNYTFSHR